MKTSRLVLLLSSTSLFGMIIGASVMWLAWQHWVAHTANRCFATAYASAATVDLRTLQSLQGGDTKRATHLLTSDLNNQIIGIGSYARASASLRRDWTVRLVLQQVRHYREQYPYKESSGDQTLIRSAFDLFGGQESH